jgi:hypothetical protein
MMMSLAGQGTQMSLLNICGPNPPPNHQKNIKWHMYIGICGPEAGSKNQTLFPNLQSLT